MADAIMKMVTDIEIDLYGETRRYLASAKQGDKATRFMRVRLMNSGVEFQIPRDILVIANISKPDGTFCYNQCAVEDNRVMVELTSQSLAAWGTAYCDIELRTTDGEKILSSAAFSIEIEKSMRNENAIISANEVTALDTLINEYIGRMMNARQQVLDTEAAFKLAETARALAEAERAAQETIRQRNEQERVAAEQTRQQQLRRMETATEKADTAADNANTAADRAEGLYMTEEALENTLEAMRGLYEQMQEMKTGIAINVDGGRPDSIDPLICDGGTPYTTEEINIDCGTP